MGALKVGDDPAVMDSADRLQGDLDVTGRDPAVDGDAEVALGAADHEPMAANADDLAVRLAVVTHGEHGDLWSGQRPIRDRRADRRGLGTEARIVSVAGFGCPPWVSCRDCIRIISTVLPVGSGGVPAGSG